MLEDAIQLLELLNDNPDGLTLAQITETSGLVKNKVFRILYTLEKHRIVQRDERNLYKVGDRILDFGQGIQNKTRLLDASSAVMDRLVVETSETIFLGVVNGSEALCIDARESPHSVRLFAKVGRLAPLHMGGVPKVLLAHLPEDKRNRILEQLDDAERANIEATLAQIRERGYVIVVDELDVGAHSVAAPIRNAQEQVIAAISIAGPSSRFDDETVRRYVGLVCKAANEISQALGSVPEVELSALF